MDNTIESSLIYFASCALHQKAPDVERLHGMNFENLLSLSRSHTMASIVCIALESGGLLNEPYMDKALAKQWTDEKNRAIRKNMLFDDARSQILTWMDSQGIWYIPLKGCILKGLYPHMGMRQMSDNDILYDVDFQYKVKDYMVSQGYTAISVNTGNHDIYRKPPIYNFELHTTLIKCGISEVWTQYYENVKERLIKDEGNLCGYHFTDEDFYLYMMVHMFKHFDRSGTGVRSFMDCYVFLQAKGKNLDWHYVNEETDKLGIAKFEALFRVLSERLFSDPSTFYSLNLSEKELEMFSYVMYSSTYGDIQNGVINKLLKLQNDDKPITKQTKRQYLFYRLFPDKEYYRINFPYLGHHTWCIPFICVYRILRGIRLRGRQIIEEVQVLRKAESKKRFAPPSQSLQNKGKRL